MRKSIALSLVAGIFYSVGVSAQTIDTVSIQQLLDVKSSGVSSNLEKEVNEAVEAASKRPLPLRKSPSIISVLSEEEIHRSGARDLVDLLRNIPGIDFGVDVQGTIMLVMRGNFAAEGKVLLLLDGMEMNELMYSTTQLANKIPVELIRRIEIIRGPGSAIYGGFAEYGVINIITKTQDVNGVQAGVTYGHQADGMARKHISVLGGYKKEDWQIAGALWAGRTQQGNGEFTDFYNNRFKMQGQQYFEPSAVMLNTRYKTLTISGILENYNTQVRDGFDQVTSQSYANNFRTFIAEARYIWTINEQMKLDSKISYKNQRPWFLPENSIAEADDTNGTYFIYKRNVERYRANTTLSYDITKKINFISGIEYFYDDAKTNEISGTFYDDSYRLQYNNIAAFVQTLFKFRWANITAGARFDRHSQAGSAFAPRLGITKKYDKWHGKLLYGNSFRAPGIENINLSENGNIKPEKSTVIEMEVGYQATDNTLFTLSFFDIETKRPIVYIVDGTDEYYRNVSNMGTQGVEAEYRYKSDWGSITANYSFYTNANKSKVAIYDVPDQDGANLGSAQHKLNVMAGIAINKNLTLSPNINFWGKRYGYAPLDDSGLGELKKYNPTTLLNFSVKYSDLFVKGLSATLGGYNLLNQENPLLSNYYNEGGHAPLPNNPREVMLRLTYQY